MPLWLPFAVVMAIIAVISGVVVYGVSLVNKVEDSIRPDDSTPTIQEEVKTAEATNYQINSVAISNGGSIAALADVIYDQFRLPIDYYVTVDMQALVDMVDNFGGIEVYIPHDMSYGGSKLLKGYRNLNGASAEFFVRCRHGDGYANSDIDRLNMQRYFYAGIHGRAQRGQDRHLCRLLLRGAGCGFHCKPAQPVFLHLHRPH